jgi:hypothetical protein
MDSKFNVPNQATIYQEEVCFAKAMMGETTQD